MWTCEKCGRIFQRVGQQHSCKRVSLESHFKNKPLARFLFDQLFAGLKEKTSPLKIISLPCCIHLFGHYDFLAALPKKDGLEVRIALDRMLENPRLKQAVSLSTKFFKNCFFVAKPEELDGEFFGWLVESYYLKDKG